MEHEVSSRIHTHYPSMSCFRFVQSMPLFHLLKSIFLLSPHLRLGLPNDLLPSNFPPKPCMQLYCLPHMPLDLSFLLIFPPNYEGCGIRIISSSLFNLCTPLFPRSSYTQMSSSPPFSPIPSVYIPPST